jgi:hypothetical protein
MTVRLYGLGCMYLLLRRLPSYAERPFILSCLIIIY